MARRRHTVSIRFKLAVWFWCMAALSAALGLWVSHVVGSALWGWLLIVGVTLLPAVWLATLLLQPVRQLLRALSGTVASYREGNFSQSLVVERDDELGELMAAHNELATALRTQRAHLVQRELLLDTVMQNSPVALLLVDAHERIGYANLASRQVLSEGRSLTGLPFADVLQRAPPALRAAAAQQGDSLFSAEIDGVEETLHLSQRAFVLQGRPYRLYLLKTLTRELSRQEVSTWKKLIRVLSHELNNSLGPLSSLAHSGAEIARREQSTALPPVFRAIAERAEHLHHFVGSYATFAKLPAPRPERIDWPAFLSDLARQSPFACTAPVPAVPGWFDRVQIEQVLINLLKNAHEAEQAQGAGRGQEGRGREREDGVAQNHGREHAGRDHQGQDGEEQDHAGRDHEERKQAGHSHSAAEQITVELAVMQSAGFQRIEVRDRGSGMSQAVLAQALLPFYSTKRSGTGLGLALAREIAEAHGGKIHLANRDGGGLRVTLDLPTAPSVEVGG